MSDKKLLHDYLPDIEPYNDEYLYAAIACGVVAAGLFVVLVFWLVKYGL